MKKSVVIIGKGPSVKNCTKQIIDSYDQIAICNFPPMEGYEQYIGNKADYHFLNAHDPNPYNSELLNNLELKYMFNTHEIPHPGFKNCFPQNEVLYNPNYGKVTVEHFIKNYGFHPSTGTQAFYYFVTKPEYDTIGLVGFDFFKVGEKSYYYPPSEVQASLKYLYSDNNTPFNKKGIRVQENSHNSKKSENFTFDMVKKYNKKLRIIK